MGCEKCVYLVDDGEIGDYGSRLYYNWICSKRPNVGNLKSFPFKKEQPCFLMDFWHSEFANEVDGSNESYDNALEKWSQKYCKDEQTKS